MSRITTRIIGWAIVTIALGTAGCQSFPFGRSSDRSTFVSTPHRPLTISLVNTVSGEQVWRKEVPVGKKLVMAFEHQATQTADLTPATPATAVHWSIMDPGEGGWLFSSLNHTQDLSGEPVMIKMSIRGREVGEEEQEQVPSSQAPARPADQRQAEPRPQGQTPQPQTQPEANQTQNQPAEPPAEASRPEQTGEQAEDQTSTAPAEQTEANQGNAPSTEEAQ